MPALDLCIIGFGISGIATTRWATAQGLRFVTLEREAEGGGVWITKSYPGVILQTTKHSYSFSDMPMSEATPLHPGGDDLLRYFKSYIQRHALNSHVQYRCEVVSIPHRTGDYHRVMYRDLKSGRLETIHARHLAICSGFYTHPKWAPDIDLRPFRGTSLHISDISPTGKAVNYNFRGKRVVVIGNGPSGCDVAIRAVEDGALTVDLVFRSPRWIFTRYCGLLGLNFFSNRIFLWIATKLPTSLFIAILYSLFYIPYYLSGAHHNLDLPTEVVNRNNLTLHESFMIYLNLKKFRYIQPKEVVLDGHRARYRYDTHSDETLDIDVVISATGYHIGIPFLGLHEIPNLYKRCLVVNDPTVAFIGFAPSFNWIQVADLQARWFIKSIVGEHRIPPFHEREEALNRELRRYETLPYEYNDLAYVAYIYCDDLAADLGIVSHTHKTWGHWWRVPRHDEWAGFKRS